MGMSADRPSSIVTCKDIVWEDIKSAFAYGLNDPSASLQLAQRYARSVADEQKDSLVLLQVPYAALEEKSSLGNIYAVEGMGLRLGPQLRRHTQSVPHPQYLPLEEDYVALSGGGRAVLTASSFGTVVFLETLLASRDTSRGREQLGKFLKNEAASLAMTDGENRFRNNHFITQPENMFAALLENIRPLVGERQRRYSMGSAIAGRPHLYLV